MFLGLLLAAVVLDPFDRGLLGGPVRGVAEQGPRTANASRARDPAFDGAIFGNSHIQLVDPDALRAATGIAFVSLIVPGTGPREQLTLIDYFLRARTRPPRSVVLGLDGAWCTQDPALPIEYPFPFWLYDPSPFAFIKGLVRYSTLEHMTKAVEMALGRASRARPNGYWNYARDRPLNTEPSALLSKEPDTPPVNETGRFPALDRLGERLERLSPEVAVVLVRPPVYITVLPRPGTSLQRSEADCLAATRRLLSVHARSALVDLRIDRPEARQVENWFDHTHYQEPLARLLESEIEGAINGLTGSR